MKGDPTNLLAFLANNKCFYIPMYQRTYSWREEQCRQLFADLETTIEKKKSSHFFGSLVAVPDTPGLVVIDGQQRLTTISLLLLALKFAFLAGHKSSEKYPETLDAYIHENFLYNKWGNVGQKLRLHHIPDDADVYAALFDNPEYESESKIVRNFHLFQSLIEETDLTADEILEAIERLFIIAITIDKSDNPQLVFESINSTGLDLTEGDKIRNFVLMDLGFEIQSSLYNKYWKKIEQLTARGNAEDGIGLFVRDFLTAVTAKIPNLDRTYTEFKKYCSETPELFENREELFKQLLSYAQNYHQLLSPVSMEIPEIAQCLGNINKQEISPSFPFILEVFAMWQKKELTQEQVSSILSIIDAFAFRRQMCDLPTNSLNKIFTDLNKAICKLDNNVPYEERMKRVLLDKDGKSRFPGDVEFRQAMTEKKVYEMRTKNRAYLFARLENGTSNDAVIFGSLDAVYSKIVNKEYTIEHIMPQSLTSSWRSSLGERHDDIHETWLHRLGNLTLTSYNSTLSNKDFREKTGRSFKQLTDNDFGFAESAHHLWLNEFLAQQSQWTEKEIKNRSQMLAARALKIWPMISTDFVPKNETEDFSICQNKPDFFTGSTPISFTLEGDVFRVSTWVELYLQVAGYLYRKNPAPMLKLASSTIEKGLDNYFRSKASTSYRQVGEGVALYKNTSTADKVHVLNQLFELYDILDATVTLAPRQTDDDDDDTEQQESNGQN